MEGLPHRGQALGVRDVHVLHMTVTLGMRQQELCMSEHNMPII